MQFMLILNETAEDFARRNDPAQANRSRHHKAFQDPEMADRLLQDDAQALRNTLCFENASGLFGADDADAPPAKRRMSDELASRHLSVLGNRDALDAALNWYRANVSDGGLTSQTVGPIRVPTMFLWSDADIALCREGAEATGDYIDAPYRFEIIEGVNHWVTEIAGEEVAKTIQLGL